MVLIAYSGLVIDLNPIVFFEIKPLKIMFSSKGLHSFLYRLLIGLNLSLLGLKIYK